MNFLSSKRKNWFETTWPAILIVGAWLWLFWPMMTGHAVCGFRDSGYLYYPLFKWIDAQWAAGDIPLWNQYDQFGVPVVADGSSSVFYPGKLIFFLRFLSYEARYGIYLAVHVLIAAGSCFWFARRLGCGQGGATFSAVSYAFGGSVLFQVCNVIYLVGAAWLPAALGCVWLMYKNRSFSWAITGGFFCALIMLGGDPQLVYNIGLIGLGTIFGGFSRARRQAHRRNDFGIAGPIKQTWVPICHLATLVFVTAILAAIQILPTADWAAESERNQYDAPRSIYELARVPKKGYVVHGVDDSLMGLIGPPDPDSHLDHAFQFSQPPWSIAELFVPNLSGKPFPTNGRWSDALPGADRMWVPSLYSGCLAAIFGLLAVRLSGKRRRQVWLSRVGLFFGLGSFGWYGLGWLAGEFVDLSQLPFDVGPQIGGVYWLLVVVVPKYVMFRYPAKLFVIAALSMCLLAGLFVNQLQIKPSGKWLGKLYVVPVICLILMLLITISSKLGLNEFWSKVPPDPLFGPFDRSSAWWSIQLGLLQVVLISSTTIYLLRREKLNFSLYQYGITLIVIVDLILANQWMLAQVPHAVFTDHVDHSIDDGPITQVTPYPIFWKNESSKQRLQEVISWQRKTLFPKHHLEVPLQHAESFSSIARETNIGRVPFMEPRIVFLDSTKFSGRPPSRATIVEERNGYVKAVIETDLSFESVLIKNWKKPDWHCRVTTTEGSTAAKYVWSQRLASWSVSVPKGKSTIEFVYRPKAFSWGAWISGIGWAILLLLTGFQTVRINSRRLRVVVTRSSRTRTQD